MSSGKLIFRFEEIGQEHNEVVGKKCANLGEMTRMGLPVPSGFAVSIEMYKKFIQDTGAAQEVPRYVNCFGELKDKGIAVFEELVDELVG